MQETHYFNPEPVLLLILKTFGIMLRSHAPLQRSGVVFSTFIKGKRIAIQIFLYFMINISHIDIIVEY